MTPLASAKRVVVKIGSSLLTNAGAGLDRDAIADWTRQIAALRARGVEVLVVSSGAIAEGMKRLAWKKRPHAVNELQAAAAVGQMGLVQMWESCFAETGLHTAQVLLTHEDLGDRRRYLNARTTLRTLVALGVVPIINENDAISFTELKFGDNDKLSALVASLLPADLLIILTTVDGVIENFGKADPKTISIIEHIDGAIEKMAGGTDSATAVGGMKSKVEAAKIVVRSGIPLVIASGKKKHMLANVLAGEEEGTLFVPQGTKLQGRKRWIAFFHHPKGALFVDDGARQALREKGRSLLPPGVARCEGNFAAEDVVRICDLNGTEFARGIAAFSSSEINARTLQRVEVVHRDNLVIL